MVRFGSDGTAGAPCHAGSHSWECQRSVPCCSYVRMVRFELAGTAGAPCRAGFDVMAGPVQGGQNYLRSMPCRFGQMDGPVQGG